MLETILKDFATNSTGCFQAFEVEDPFNPRNVLKGYLSKIPDHRYGAIAITNINGKEAYQIHFATPKQHYPFGKTGQFHFPTAKEIEVYEKIDGTNVCAYRYSFDGKQFQTYKLRLHPVLRNSKFGDFLDMWKELLQRYPQIEGICETNEKNISFEMYGSRNTHLVLYTTPLDVALLFGIDNQAQITPPSRVKTLEIPVVNLICKMYSQQDLVAEYNRLREETEKNNVKNEDETISGIEGFVWYLTDIQGNTIQFKCKPESIEKIAWDDWSAASGIDINIIKATAHNVLETEDKITYEATVQLLQEEFTAEQIQKSEIRIRKLVSALQEWYEFQNSVIEIYRSIGSSVHDDKAVVMKAMSQHFPKNMMKKVYTAITQQGK